MNNEVNAAQGKVWEAQAILTRKNCLVLKWESLVKIASAKELAELAQVGEAALATRQESRQALNQRTLAKRAQATAERNLAAAKAALAAALEAWKPQA